MDSSDPPADLDWSPLLSGGAAFATHHVVAVTPKRLELHPSAGARVLIGVVVAVGVIALGFVIWGIAVADLAAIFTAGVFVLTSGVLAPLLRRQLDNRRWFDAELGSYWSARVGRPGPDAVPLASIRGLQILPKVVASSEGDYSAYELNLVLTDGRRVNVLSHANLERLYADSAQIAAFLRAPLWIEHGLGRLTGSPPPG